MICALLNESNGGYIFTGIDKANLIVKGEEVSGNEVAFLKQKLKKARESIGPNNYECDLGFIPVENGLFSEEEEKRNLFAIRVKVNPVRRRTLYYIIQKRTGYESLYSSFSVKDE